MFKKIVVFNFYDGPLSGIACEDDLCKEVSRFDLLAWDSEQDQRIFCVGRIKDGELLFRDVVDIFRRRQAERWPVWCPNEVPVEDRDEWERISRALDQHRDYQFAVLTDQINHQPEQIKVISGQLKSVVQDFIRTSQLQDWETCRALLAGSTP